MADNRATFRASLDKWAGLVESQLEALARQSFQATAEIAFVYTPIDTGFLQGNWQPSIGKPNSELNPLGTNKAGPATVALIAKDLKLGEIIYYTNNTAYARYQEYGTHAFSGRFFVQRAVRRWQVTVDEQAHLLGFGR